MSAGTNPRFAWPIVIDSTCDQFTFNDGAPWIVDVPNGTYYWRDDGSVSDFRLALKTALDATGSALVFTVSLATTGLLTISAGGAFTLNWGTVAHDLSNSLLGFANADQASVGNACVSDYHVGYAWLLQQMVVEDSEDIEVSSAVPTVIEGGRGRVAMYGDRVERVVLIDALPTAEVLVASETVTQRSFQRFYRYARTGGRFEYCPDSATPGTYSSYQVLDQTWLQRFPATRTPRTIQRWDVPVPMAQLVP